MKKLTLIVFFLFLAGAFTTAQAQDSFEEWRRNYLQQFQEFQDARDREFMDMLNRGWRAVGSTTEDDTYEQPKPFYLPEYRNPEPGVSRPTPRPPAAPVDVPEREAVVAPAEPIPIPEFRAAPPTVPGYRESSVDFYTQPLAYSYPSEFNGARLNFRPEEQSIRSFWGTLGSADYEPMLEQARRLKERFALNDWGYAHMLHRMGEDIYGDGSGESVLFTWFMLTKSGYRARVGYDQVAIYLLLPTRTQLFNTKFFRIDGIKYYALMLDSDAPVPSSIFTYEGNYPAADRTMDLALVTPPRVPRTTMEKNFEFSYGGEDFEVPVTINPNVIAFYELYPLTELDVYLEAPISTDTRNSLFSSLAAIIEGKSEAEAVNMLLRFVQTAFEYRTDQQQFGYEKYLFPEETLFYSYSDCDDRTILFSTLVRELTGLDVAGVRYPRHLAAAIRFTEEVEGQYVTIEGERYTIADPTYVNADIGAVMPQYRNQNPEIVMMR